MNKKGPATVHTSKRCRSFTFNRGNDIPRGSWMRYRADTFPRCRDFPQGRSILGVDVHAMLIPQHNFVPGIPRQVDHFGTQLRMAVIRELHHPSAMSVDQTTVTNAAIQQNQVASIASPVDRRDQIAVAFRFKLMEQASFTVKNINDSLIPPVRRHTQFQSWQVRPVVAHTDALSVPDQLLIDDVTFKIGDDEPFVTAGQGNGQDRDGSDSTFRSKSHPYDPF